ncbi:hypothetical protein BU15DRAFT_49576 [Melanogaster broomeanus]|nr:hypothetical protein BU15DRAFT_49576 [Melanogaster broomeanus]
MNCSRHGVNASCVSPANVLWPLASDSDNHYTLGHYDLWKAGIHHHDVTCENLMSCRVKGKVISILYDYDQVQSNQPLGNKRTPGILFMAIDRLHYNGQGDQVQHRYRHDMESFIWVFVWMSLQYKDGKLQSTGPLDAWTEVNALRCACMKRDFLYVPQWPEDLDFNTKGHVKQFIHFLKIKIHSRSIRNDSRPLDKALRQLARIQNQADPPPSRIKQLEKEIKCYERYVEEPDHVVFGDFMGVISGHQRSWLWDQIWSRFLTGSFFPNY